MWGYYRSFQLPASSYRLPASSAELTTITWTQYSSTMVDEQAFVRGRTRFDGDTVSQDACRGPSTSSKDGNQPNCGYAARSRSLITCERLPSPAYGRGPDVILVGWL